MVMLFLPGQTDEEVKEIVFDAYLEGIRNGLYNHGSYLDTNFKEVTKLALELNCIKRLPGTESKQKPKNRLVQECIFEAMIDALKSGVFFNVVWFNNLSLGVSKTLFPEEDGQDSQ